MRTDRRWSVPGHAVQPNCGPIKPRVDERLDCSLVVIVVTVDRRPQSTNASSASNAWVLDVVVVRLAPGDPADNCEMYALEGRSEQRDDPPGAELPETSHGRVTIACAAACKTVNKGGRAHPVVRYGGEDTSFGRIEYLVKRTPWRRRVHDAV